MPSLACKGLEVDGVLIGDSVVIVDNGQARVLYSCGFYGQPLEVEKPRGADFHGPLRLSIVESLYLLEMGVLKVRSVDGSPKSAEDLRKLVDSNPRFRMLYVVYRQLRDRGLIVRSGLKFGGDYAVYRLGPGIDHAPFIIHVYGRDSEIDPVEIVRAGRLSHSVKKRFVFAVVAEGGGVDYVMVDWFRP
ncbi:MAG: tRNA-intron lyase [Aeropyrum sp.]|nr:tRNA-intron lyase [Aeropyrum sp.]MCE4615601.1 tRNA-intron lyase [Aeropyrum sp.]